MEIMITVSLFVSGMVAGLVAWDIVQRCKEVGDRAAAKAELADTMAKLITAHNAFVEAQKALGDRLQTHDIQIRGLMSAPPMGRKF